MAHTVTQVSDLEEERRKLRLEVKFRAKYHGKTALEMGLSPEQLLLLEEYVDGLKGGRNPEERLVTQLQQRVRCALQACLMLLTLMLLSPEPSRHCRPHSKAVGSALG